MTSYAVVVTQGALSTTLKFEAEDLEALVSEFEAMLLKPTIIKRKGEVRPNTAFVLITSPATTFEIRGTWDEYQKQVEAAVAARQVVPASALIGARPGVVLPRHR